MTPYDCDKWVTETVHNLHTTDKDKYKDYVFDRVLYWRLELSSCRTIDRDREWFKKNLSVYKKMWEKVEYYRKHHKIADLFRRYVETYEKVLDIEQKKRQAGWSIHYSNKLIKHIMDVMDRLMNNTANDYKNFIASLEKEIEEMEDKLKFNEEENDMDYGELESEFCFI